MILDFSQNSILLTSNALILYYAPIMVGTVNIAANKNRAVRRCVTAQGTQGSVVAFLNSHDSGYAEVIKLDASASLLDAPILPDNLADLETGTVIRVDLQWDVLRQFHAPEFQISVNEQGADQLNQPLAPAAWDGRPIAFGGHAGQVLWAMLQHADLHSVERELASIASATQQVLGSLISIPLTAANFRDTL